MHNMIPKRSTRHPPLHASRSRLFGFIRVGQPCEGTATDPLRGRARVREGERSGFPLVGAYTEPTAGLSKRGFGLESKQKWRHPCVIQNVFGEIHEAFFSLEELFRVVNSSKKTVYAVLHLEAKMGN